MTWANYGLLAAECLNPATGRAWPGKFEAESLYAPYFYNASLEGCDEVLSESGSYCGLVEITADDRAFFSGTELAIDESFTHAVLTESDNGFVSCWLISAEEAEQLRNQYESADVSELDE